ncbi:MAG: Gfo/Idh/MocA family protein, partial [Pirellulaceae bacterium]
SFVRGISAGLAAPHVITSAALGGQGQVAASERITMGAIGLGGRGKHDLTALLANPDVHMMAVCDCQGDRRTQGKEMVNKHYGNQDCDTHIDFRELLARDDIDAVLIATGDNNHSLVSVHAAKAGKDIYCEKPMSVVVAEGRATADMVQRYGVIYQCGTQRRSVGRFKYAVELAQSGKLGELKEVYAEKAPSEWFGELHERTLPAQPQPPRDVVDWDQWLGTAPWRPYNKGYMARKFWGGHRDFSGGTITEWGSHTADLCQWANRADDTSPVEYELAEGTVIAYYANGVKLIFEKGKWPLHVKFVGTEGWIYADDDGTVKAEPKSLLAGRQFGKGYPNEGHVRNFLDCVKSRRQPIAPPEGAHRANSTCQVANICMRLGRKVTWDPVNEKFVNDPMADRQLVRACRGPWQL